MSLATDLSGTYTANDTRFGTIQISVDDFGWVTGTWKGVNWTEGGLTISAPDATIAPGSFAYYSPGEGLSAGANYLVITARGSLPSPSTAGYTWMFTISVSMYREVQNGTSTGSFTAVVTLMRDGIGNSHHVDAFTVLFTKS